MQLSKIAAGVLFVMLLTQTANLWAEESDFYIQQGVYIGLSGVYNIVGDDFDGRAGYRHVNNTYLTVLPDVDSAFGFGVFTGYRLERWALEVGYQRVVHDSDTVYAGIGKGESVYQALDINVKIDVFPQERFRPFALIGGGGAWLDSDNTKMHLPSGSLADSRYEGWNVNLGAGFAYYFTPKWFLTTTAMYRWQHFKQVEDDQLSVDAMGSGMNISVGIAYTF